MTNKLRLLSLSVMTLAIAGCAVRPGTSSYTPVTPSSKQGESSAAPSSQSVAPTSSGDPTQDIPSSYADVNEKIIVWCAAEEQAVLETVVNEYNARQTVETSKFNYEFVAVSEKDGASEIQKNPTSATSATLFNFADDQLYTLQNLKILQNITGDYRTRTEAKNSELSMNASHYNSKLYAYPYTSDNGYFLWYNGDELSEDDVKSLETILDKCESKNKSFLMDISNGFYSSSFLLSPDACGLDSLKWKEDENGNAVYVTNWDNETGVKCSEYLASICTPRKTKGYITGGSNAEIAAGFASGKVIAAVSGTWMENDLKSKCSNLKAAVLPSYHIDGKSYQMATMVGSKLLGINANHSAAKKRAAAALGELLSSYRAQQVRFDKRASLPSNIAFSQSDYYKQNMTIGGKAYNDQVILASAAQSACAEARYWDIGGMIGQAYLDSNLGSFDSWKTFLGALMNMLRKPQV